MNKVYLNGTVASAPLLRQPEGGIPHVTFQLMVSHKTSKGQIRRELYPVNAWLKAAQWAQGALKQGMSVALQGYLTQKTKLENGVPHTYVEITADTFMQLAVPTKGTVHAVDTTMEATDETDEEASSWT